MSPGWRRRGCVALLAIAAGCYETRATRIRVRVPTTRLDCAEPGADYDRAVQDLARRLDAAFGERRPSE